jgi:radical SAM family uncharacterized protein
MITWEAFRRPQRYLDCEWNVIKKSHNGRIKIALCFPDLYEVGMSNLGLRIIYGLLNEIEDVVCERAFMPDLDFGEYLRKRNKKLFSLETKTPLDAFDILGFNLSYGLNFTNFLYMLEAARIPLIAEERVGLIVLGGGVTNPEPLAKFVDVFFLGEFEEKAYQFIEVLRRYQNKESRLRALAEIEGFYVPKFYEVIQEKERFHFVKKYRYAQFPIRKVYVKDLNSSYYPLDWLTPYTQIVHDRAQIEIARGCPHNCYFCQARCLYYPYRERSVDCILEYLDKIYKKSGYENFSFLALSASDYSQIEALLDKAEGLLKGKGVGISLPSLRVDDLVGRLHKKLWNLKKTSLTLAIEAATPSLRRRINKEIDIDAFLDAKDILKSLNLRHIKIYFMFGLPYESEEDLVRIGELLDRLIKELGLNINANINIFIPSPFSQFENFPMEKESSLFKKRRLILDRIDRRRVKVSISSIRRSIVEATILRGDRKLAGVIYQAYTLGARLDSYREFFKWEIWEAAFKKENIDYHRYLESFPYNFSWSHIKWHG